MDLAIIAIIIAAISLITIIVLFFQFLSLKKVVQKLTTGFSEGNLAELVTNFTQTLESSKGDIDRINQEFERFAKETKKFYRKLGLIRFQAFKDTGGDQSFALAILDENNNGFTLSSLYGRDISKVYAKRIVAGKPESHQLTDEEQQALNTALES